MSKALWTGLIFILLAISVMSCGSYWIKISDQMDFQTDPSPIRTENGLGSFDVKIVLPPDKQYQRLDSMEILFTTEEFQLGLVTINIPPDWERRSTLRYSHTIEIDQPLQDDSWIYFKPRTYRKGNSRISPFRMVLGSTKETRGNKH